MTGDTEVEVPVVDNKVEEVVKTDKEVIAEEEKELIENEKKDEPEKTEEDKEEVTEPKKLNLLQKLFGKRKDVVVPTIDEVAKTDKEVIVEGDKAEKADEEKAEKTDEEKAEKTDEEKTEKTDEDNTEKTDEEKTEKTDEEKTEKTDEEKKEEPTKVQTKLKKLFSMKKTKKDVVEKVERAEGEDKIEEGDEEKKDEKNDEENTNEEKKDEEKEGEEAIEEVAEADMSTTTAEKKTLMQKLMTIKRDLMANKKDDKVEEEKEGEEKKEGEEEKAEEKKEGDEEVKVEGEETIEDDSKDELGNDKPKPNNRIKKFFSMKRESKPVLTKEGVEDEGCGMFDEGAENIEKTEKVNLLQRLFGRKEKVEEEKKDTETKDEAENAEGEKNEEATEVKAEEVAAKVEDTVEKIMMVHLVNRTLAIPSISPMQLKLESWLKFHQIKYENTHNKDNLPASAYLPMQSNDYLAELADTHNKQMPMELDADQKNTQHAMMTLVEKNIHFAILSWQCSNVDNIIKGYKINLQTYLNSKVPLALLKLFFKNNFCKSGIKLVKSNGFAQNNTEEIEKLAKDDLKVLAEMLGDKEFFFGSSASLLDLVVFSHLSQITVVDDSVACALRDHIKAEHENLLTLVDRMRTLTWGEHWEAATEQLEMNPHIPKPVVEEVKEIVEEDVEKATEEKVEDVVEVVEVVEIVEDKVEDAAVEIKVEDVVLDNKVEDAVVDKVEEVSEKKADISEEEVEAKAE